MAVIENPFEGLINGVLQGHALALQLKREAMQEQAFQEGQARAAAEDQLRDMDMRMRLATAGRPVTGNAVDESFEAPVPSSLPGLIPERSQTVRYLRPVDKSRLLTYKTRDGQQIQVEAYTPEEAAERQARMALGARRYEALGGADIQQEVRHYAREHFGVAAPDILVRAGLAQPGQKLLEDEIAEKIPAAQKLLTPVYKDVPEGGSLIALPQPAIGAPAAAAPAPEEQAEPTASSAFGSAPTLGEIQAQRDQSRQNFVNAARNAGQPPAAPAAAPGQPQVVFQGRPKLTGDFEKVFLPAYARKQNKSVDQLSPDETMDAVRDYAKRSKDPNVAAVSAQIAQLNLDIKRMQLQQLQGQTGAGPAIEIKPQTPAFRVAQDLAYGKLTFHDFAKLYSYSRNPAIRLAVYDKARELNPAFDEAMYEAGYKFASNPKIQQQLAALDNVQTGVEDLLRLSDQASRSGVTAVNKYIVKGGVALGGKHYSNFETAITGFADELSGALGFGSATDMSREMGYAMTNGNLSPENFRSAIQDVVIPFIERKRNSMLKLMGPYGMPGVNPAAPAAAPANAQPGTRTPRPSGQITVRAGDGSVHPFQTEAEARRFEALVRGAGGTTTRQ